MSGEDITLTEFAGRMLIYMKAHAPQVNIMIVIRDDQHDSQVVVCDPGITDQAAFADRVAARLRTPVDVRSIVTLDPPENN